MPDIIYIKKINEVYNKILCEDRGILRELSEYFSFFAPNYQFMPSFKNKYWDGKVRLFNSITYQLYKGLSCYVEQFAKERGYEIEYDYDISAENFSLKEGTEFIDNLLKESNIKLVKRDYQVKAFTDAVRYRRQILLSPTACMDGETLIDAIVD